MTIFILKHYYKKRTILEVISGMHLLWNPSHWRSWRGHHQITPHIYHLGAATMFKLIRCLMVGRPCGQFHGCSISPIWQTSLHIWGIVSAVPIMMLLRHALEANMALTRDGRHMTPGASESMNIISSMSSRPNSHPRLKGIETRLTRRPAGFSSSMRNSNPFFLNISRLSSKTDSLTAVSSSTWGIMRRWFWRTQVCCSVSKLYFSSVACWSIMKRSELRRAMINPKLNCPNISIWNTENYQNHYWQCKMLRSKYSYNLQYQGINKC